MTLDQKMLPTQSNLSHYKIKSICVMGWVGMLVKERTDKKERLINQC